MSSGVQLRLGGPLFLNTLIIANASRDSAADAVGAKPPKVQSVVSFVTPTASRKSVAERRRTALAAVHIAATFFVAAGVRAPAGVCPDRKGPSPERLSKLPPWLAQVAALNAMEALQCLARSTQSIPAKLRTRVESEYNAGVKAAGCGLKPLERGELARNFASMLPSSAGDGVPTGKLAPTPSSLPAPKGRFYYIAAGVGCGIKEAEEVCSDPILNGKLR
jgi:hypothetical protein